MHETEVIPITGLYRVMCTCGAMSDNPLPKWIAQNRATMHSLSGTVSLSSVPVSPTIVYELYSPMASETLGLFLTVEGAKASVSEADVEHDWRDKGNGTWYGMDQGHVVFIISRVEVKP